MYNVCEKCSEWKIMCKVWENNAMNVTKYAVPKNVQCG